MRKALLTFGLLGGSAFAAGAALADDAPVPAASASAFTITGGADLASQYRFRGISLSNNKAAVQATITIAHVSGFYLSAWGSSARSDSWIDVGGSEIDVYGGYSHSFETGFTVDGGLYGYIFPGSGHAIGVGEDRFEVYGDVSRVYGPITARAGLNWAPDQSGFRTMNGSTRYNMYVYGELGFSLPTFPIAFHSHLGHTGGSLDYVGRPYLDYKVGATYTRKALAFDISLVGTDISRRNVREYTGIPSYRTPYRDARAVPVGTVTASF